MFKPTSVILLLHALSLVTASPFGQHLHPRHRHIHEIIQPDVEVVVITTTIHGGSVPAKSPAPDFHIDNKVYTEQKKTGQKPNSDGIVSNLAVDHSTDEDTTTDGDTTTHEETPEHKDPPQRIVPPLTESKSTTTQDSGNQGGGSQQSDCSTLGGAPDVQGATQKDLALWYINYHRCNHTDTKPLEYHQDLEDEASSCAKQCNGHCDIHQGGQCIANPPKPGNLALTGAIKMWYYGENEYFMSFTKAGELTDAGRTSQLNHIELMVTPRHVAVGCGIATCNGGPFVVCNFKADTLMGAPPSLGVALGEPDWSQQDNGVIPVGTELKGGKK